MAINATTRILVDGAVNTTVQLTGISDSEGDETLVTKVDCQDLLPIPTRLKVTHGTYNVAGEGTVVLYWDGEPPEEFQTLGGGGGEIRFSKPGGLNNTDVPTTGNLLLSTKGFELNSAYSITLHLRKKFD